MLLRIKEDTLLGPIIEYNTPGIDCWENIGWISIRTSTYFIWQLPLDVTLKLLEGYRQVLNETTD